MSDPILGQVALFGFNFAPKGWALCQGQILSISQNTALFSLLGTTYGGNGTSTFALPNLQSRVPVHVGSGPGPGLSLYDLGEEGGQETVTLTTNQIPGHTHQARATDTVGDDYGPANVIWAHDAAENSEYGATKSGTFAGDALGTAGQTLPHNNRRPYLAMNYCIALVGVFPSRS
jgi:microcystin-dependent protein